MVAPTEEDRKILTMTKRAKVAKKPAKKKAPRKDASQTALSIVERVAGGKLKR